MKYAYEDYDEIELEVQDYIKFVTGVDDVRDVSLHDINSLFVAMSDYEAKRFADYKANRKAEWEDGWVDIAA